MALSWEHCLGTPPIGAGETLRFNLVLFGHALGHLPLISLALQRAVEQGLGPQRAAGRLARIEVQRRADGAEPAWAEIWQPAAAAIAAHDARFAVAPTRADAGATQAQLVFDTPLRLQHQGQPVRPPALTPRKLAADLLRRITLLAEFHAGRPGLIPDAPALVQHAARLGQQLDLHWHDWSRYSSRQRQEMTLGGALGGWTLTGELGPLLPWLRLGEWLHVGKNATLGLGRYRLAHPSAAPSDPTPSPC